MNESLDSRQLKAFVSLAKTGSHTSSAKELCLTHSAVSHSIRKLEEQVACRLFHKLGKKVTLTEAGETLLIHAERALSEMHQARMALAGLNKWGSRRLRLVAEPALVPTLLTPALLKFHREFPRCLIQVEMNGGDDLVSLLEHNRADLVLAEKPPDHDGMAFISLLADRFHFVVNAAHPLAACHNVTYAELAKQPCLLLRTSGHGRKRLEDYLSQRGMGLIRAGEIESVDTIKEMVKQLPVMAILPGWAVATELKSRTFITLAPARKPLEQTWGVIHSLTRPPNHTEATFLKFCRQQVAELG